MTLASDASAPTRSSFGQSLAQLATWTGRLSLAAVVLGIGGLIAAGIGYLPVALGAAMSATTLLLLAGLGWATARLRSVQSSNGAQALAIGLADDPDPVVVTDVEGRALAANRAGAEITQVVERLRDWSAVPEKTQRDMLVECFGRDKAARELLRKDKGIRVTAHRARQAGDLIVWRFAPLAKGRARGFDTVDVPLVALTDVSLTANAAARTFLEIDGDTGLAPLADRLTLAASRQVDPVLLRLPDGRRLRAMPVPGGDRQAVWLLLPDPGIPAIDLAADTASLRGFEDIPVALMTLDTDGQIVTSNRLARSLLGLDDDAPHAFWEIVEGLGRPVSDWLDDARAGRALGRPEVLRATLTPDETFVQIILRRAHGGVGDGSLVAVISDATELKSLEARFVQSQKMQAIGQLAGGVAHDFNNLLTAISGHCDLLLINRDRYDPDYNDLLQIHQNANRAAALVRQLLAFSRKQTLKPETFHLESLLEDLTHLLTRLVGERIALNLVHDRDLAPIRADRRQLEQVIMNLVVNARDAMPMGGTIRIQTEALHLDTELEHGRARIPAGDYAAVRVVDEGLGIPPAIIDKVFEPFFTTKKLGEGTGLGLSTAYGIVKQMGGYIFADSVEGSGTTFTLYFASQPGGVVNPATLQHHADPGASRASMVPAVGETADAGARAAAKPQPGPATPASSAPGDEARQDPRLAPTPGAPRPQQAGSASAGAVAVGSILLVEDEAPVRAFAARALRLQGYQVFEAQDGEQALEFLCDQALHVDLFVTDVIMPGVDGPGWVSEALVDRPGTPVVFMSGYTEDTLSAALGRIPRAVFLGKPFSLKDLSDTIAQQLRMDAVG